MRRDWPWPEDQLDYFGRKAMRAMADHERAGELCRSCLIWLALCGSGGFAVRDLRSWTRRVSLAQLREFVESFDTPGLREWVERQVGFPQASGGFGRTHYARPAARALPDGMREK